MKLIVRGTVIGVFVGLIISMIHSYIFADGLYYPMSPYSGSGEFFYRHLTETSVLIIALMCWALIGIGFILAGKVFQKEDWSIFKMTITHFVTVIVFFLPLSIISGWYPLEKNAIIFFLILFIIIYTLIWGIMLVINMLHIKKINNKLNG